MLGTAKVAQLENPTVRVEQEVLRFNVTVADTVRVDVGQGPKELIHVQLDKGDGDGLLLLAVLPGHLVHCLGNVLQYQIQVDLVLEHHKSQQY